MVNSVETWPCYNIMSDLSNVQTNHLICGACHQPGIAMRIILYGNPYNSATVETVQLNDRIYYEKVCIFFIYLK